jgi:hypothetical protein
MAARPMEMSAPWDRVGRGRGMIEPLRKMPGRPFPISRNKKHEA